MRIDHLLPSAKTARTLASGAKDYGQSLEIVGFAIVFSDLPVAGGIAVIQFNRSPAEGSLTPANSLHVMPSNNCSRSSTQPGGNNYGNRRVLAN